MTMYNCRIRFQGDRVLGPRTESLAVDYDLPLSNGRILCIEPGSRTRVGGGGILPVEFNGLCSFQRNFSFGLGYEFFRGHS